MENQGKSREGEKKPISSDPREVFERIHSLLDVVRMEGRDGENDSVRIVVPSEFGYAFVAGRSEHLNKYIGDIRAKGRDIHLDFSRVGADLENGVLSAFYTAGRQKAEKEGSRLLISGVTPRHEAWLRQTLPEGSGFEVLSYLGEMPEVDEEQECGKQGAGELVDEPERVTRYGPDALRELRRQHDRDSLAKKPKRSKLVEVTLAAVAAVGVGVAALYVGRMRENSKDVTREDVPAVVVPGEKPTKPTNRPGAKVVSNNMEFCWGGRLGRYLRIYRGNQEPLEVPLPENYNKLSRRIVNFEKHFSDVKKLEDVVGACDSIFGYLAGFEGVSADSPALQSLSPEDREFAVGVINGHLVSRLENLAEKLESEIRRRNPEYGTETGDEVF